MLGIWLLWRGCPLDMRDGTAVGEDGEVLQGCGWRRRARLRRWARVAEGIVRAAVRRHHGRLAHQLEPILAIAREALAGAPRPWGRRHDKGVRPIAAQLAGAGLVLSREADRAHRLHEPLRRAHVVRGWRSVELGRRQVAQRLQHMALLVGLGLGEGRWRCGGGCSGCSVGRARLAVRSQGGGHGPCGLMLCGRRGRWPGCGVLSPSRLRPLDALEQSAHIFLMVL